MRVIPTGISHQLVENYTTVATDRKVPITTAEPFEISIVDNDLSSETMDEIVESMS